MGFSEEITEHIAHTRKWKRMLSKYLKELVLEVFFNKAKNKIDFKVKTDELLLSILVLRNKLPS